MAKHEFYNPYQFLAVDTERCKVKLPFADVDDLKATNNVARHDFWQSGTRSGRLSCTLKTVSPLVVGSQQTPGNKETKMEGRVKAYRNRKGEVAIPGNSLRGMVSGIAEIISQSAMRVMNVREDDFYSTRMQTSEAFKTLGVLCKRDGNWCIYPLGEGVSAYDYTDDIDSLFIRKQSCYHAIHNSKLLPYYDEKNDDNYSEGVFYVRGEHEDMPKKLHETYLPWDGEIFEDELIPVDESVIRQLEYILRERHQADPDFPYLPKGYEQHERSWDNPDKPLILEGDVLYYSAGFKLALRKEVVTALSYSAIGRRMVQGTLREAFQREAGIDVLPWDGQRAALTPAEALFGVVEDALSDDKIARNLASRLRFSDADPVAGDAVERLGEKTLKILNSPKPPSPTMYFSGASGGYIGKEDLDLNEHNPNGRKRYLVHQPDEPDASGKYRFETRLSGKQYRPWMHMICNPVAENMEFAFDIYFDNLSDDELGFLCCALQPAPDFAHRLGLGKPLGLGHIKITDMKLAVHDRTKRYQVNGLINSVDGPEVIPPPVLPSFIDERLLKQLVALGGQENINLPVCYPYSVSANPRQYAYNEAEGYEWFVCNDRAAHNENTRQSYPGQYLKPLMEKPDGEVVIPVLDADIDCPVERQGGRRANR